MARFLHKDSTSYSDSEESDDTGSEDGREDDDDFDDDEDDKVKLINSLFLFFQRASFFVFLEMF